MSLNEMNRRIIAATSFLLLLTTASCQRESAAQPASGATPPPNELWITQKQIQEAGIATTEVGDRAVGNWLTTTGRVAFSDARVGHVFSPVTGRVTSCLASLGQQVRRGTPLAILQSPDLATAVSDVEKADADLVAAQRDYERQKELYEAHAAAQRDFEAAESNYRKAKAERVRAAQKAGLLSDGRHGTQEYVLRAPIDGDVVTRNATLGVEVQGQYSGGSAPELFTIADLNPVWVLADVFEVDLPHVRIGAPVTLTVVSYPGRRFTGRVDWISGALDAATRTAKVRCTIANGDRTLRPEMFATVSIATDTHQKLAVPRTSVVRVGDQMVAYVDKGPSPNGGERFERRVVGIDDNEAGELVPVTRGLQRGEKVVSSGAIILSGSGA
ncbi:MAG TPA: efflux RND transporter periplasmic adaptor subunit [Thermoanaerobaculia bacterium]|jgi:cobalt-zinc-cadmium efflux system membrane fusion protein|nr:efflux RND transporter periplasmic adaptor subunit [Thermoanaerobaculia bacterium]